MSCAFLIQFVFLAFHIAEEGGVWVFVKISKILRICMGFREVVDHVAERTGHQCRGGEQAGFVE